MMLSTLNIRGSDFKITNVYDTFMFIMLQTFHICSSDVKMTKSPVERNYVDNTEIMCVVQAFGVVKVGGVLCRHGYSWWWSRRGAVVITVVVVLVVVVVVAVVVWSS